MNPGLPGLGVGGLFYILGALFMPICEVHRRWRGEAHVRWPLVAKQCAMAVGIVATMSGVFWALDTMVVFQEVAAQAAGKAHMAWAWSLRVSALAVTSGVLGTVLGTVQLGRLCLRLLIARRPAR